MEASALPASAGLVRPRRSLSPRLLRLRSDEQLVALLRAGHEEAFRVIHDRYRTRLLAYMRQMLPAARADAEDALQDVFVRAYRALQESSADISLRAWLYRVAHNRCVDELRRPVPPAPEVLAVVRTPEADPLAEVTRRDGLEQLVADVRRLPEQQHSALLMRELGGSSYDEVAAALDTTVPAVKSLLVRARVGLAEAAEARDADCRGIRDELALAHDEGRRPRALARRHLRDCAACHAYRREVRGASRSLALLAPGVGLPAALAGKLLGVGGGGGSAAAGSGAATGGSAAAGTGALSTGAVAAAATKVAAVVCVAVATAGGAAAVSDHPAARHAGHRAAPRAPAPRPVRATSAERARPAASHRSSATRRLPRRALPPALAPVARRARSHGPKAPAVAASGSAAASAAAAPVARSAAADAPAAASPESPPSALDGSLAPDSSSSAQSGQASAPTDPGAPTDGRRPRPSPAGDGPDAKDASPSATGP